MLAHVVYPRSRRNRRAIRRVWIEDILREEMGFRGVVFSDDIGMAAAFSAGGIKARIDAHLDAGCDVVLVCHPEAGRGIAARRWKAAVRTPMALSA